MTSQSFFQKNMPHLVAIVIFLLVNVIYFSPQIQGKKMRSGDITSFKAISKELSDHYEKTGEYSMWTNSIFGGMPAYQISMPQKANSARWIEKVSQLFIARPIGYFFSMMFIFYGMLVLLGVNPWLSMIGAVAFGLNTNSLVLFEAGHMSKLRVIAFFGMILVGILMAFRKKYLAGGILFATGLAVNLYCNHIQMTYYFFMCLLIYGIIELVQHSKRGELQSFWKAALFLIAGGVIGIGANSTRLLTTYEYAKDTMRGQPILEKEKDAKQTSSNTEGLDFGYAMQWSNGTLDLFSSFIPGVAGGGTGEPVGKNSASYRDLRARGANLGDRVKMPLYWGALPMTSGPIYFGAGIFFLFLLGALIVRGPIKWWIVSSVILTFLMSMGKNFEFFNRLLFDYFPLLNKFRTPNSVLTITSFLIPILGMLAVSDILKGKISKKELTRALYISGGALGAICLFFILMGGSFFDFTYFKDAMYAQQMNYNVGALIEDRRSLMRSDSIRSLLLIAASAGLIWAFIQNKIKENILLIGLAVLTLFDMFTVGQRYVNKEDFMPARQYANSHPMRPVDEEILKDTDPNYRVLDFSVDPVNSASTSYYHKTIGGYHPAKLQRYQDLLDRHILRNNQSVWDMLNTKYIIDQQGQLQRNPAAMGNAWFVGGYRVVDTPNQEINALNGLVPANEAIIHKEFSDYVNGLNIQKNGSIALNSYAPNRLVYLSNTTSEQLAVFSEIWYGPDKGWQAYLDGNPVEHIRVNYALRGLKIPAGEHNIEFRFEPSSYSIGSKITLVFTLLILGGFIWLISQWIREAMNAPEPVAVPKSKTKVTPTKSKKKTSKSRKKKS